MKIFTDDYYVQASFGKSKRLYTFKVLPSVFLTEQEQYEVIADDTVYSTPIQIQKILDKKPSNLDGIYIKTINTAKKINSINKEEKEENTKDTTINFL